MKWTVKSTICSRCCLAHIEVVDESDGSARNAHGRSVIGEKIQHIGNRVTLFKTSSSEVVLVWVWQIWIDLSRARRHLLVLLWYRTSALLATQDGNAFYGRKGIRDVTVSM
jgi:hypothetical protein